MGKGGATLWAVLAPVDSARTRCKVMVLSTLWSCPIHLNFSCWAEPAQFGYPIPHLFK